MLAHGEALQWSSTSLRALEQSCSIWENENKKKQGQELRRVCGIPKISEAQVKRCHM